MDNLKDQEELLFSYLGDIEPTSHRHYKDVYDSIVTDEERKKFFDEIISYGIPILQLPFYGNITKDRMFHIFDKYDIKQMKVNTTTREVIMGDMYHLRLRHEPSDKMSHRAVDFNNFTNMPTRTPDSKNHLAKVNNNPIRIGKISFAA